MITFSISCSGLKLANKVGIKSTKSRGRFLSMANENGVTKGIIIGGGRIGTYLYESNNEKDIFLNSRANTVSDVDPLGKGSGRPIYVCTRNNDLDEIIRNTPLSRRKDLVFLQNGILEPYLLSEELMVR
jgi:hypothetical protein